MEPAHLTSKYREESDRVTRCHHTIPAELLAIAIRSRTDIQGIKVGWEEFKMVQYADDLTLFVPDLESAQHIFHLFDQYEACSGLKVNYSKTEAM